MEYKYDPVLRMNVPVVTNDAEVAWQEFDRNDRVVTKRKEFKSIEAAEKFIEKVSEKNNFYRILATSDERTWDNAIQAADASRIIEQKNGYTLGINSQGTICLAFPGETIDNPHMYLGKENEKNLADAKAMFKEFSNLRGK